ncbi:hypothetical protein HYS31_07245 [Candidatus Woesearchaeota archaeon]|nr:hypothetical protein [Candidatus Woesearchaeota archaeon]
MRADVGHITGKKHGIVREFAPFVSDLEALAEVEGVGVGKFAEVGHRAKPSMYHIQYYNPTTRIIKVRATGNGFSQEFFVMVRAYANGTFSTT